MGRNRFNISWNSCFWNLCQYGQEVVLMLDVNYENVLILELVNTRSAFQYYPQDGREVLIPGTVSVAGVEYNYWLELQQDLQLCLWYIRN
jgi:hypothetical protein